jgi:hypothetical protein
MLKRDPAEQPIEQNDINQLQPVNNVQNSIDLAIHLQEASYDNYAARSMQIKVSMIVGIFHH